MYFFTWHLFLLYLLAEYLLHVHIIFFSSLVTCIHQFQLTLNSTLLCRCSSAISFFFALWQKISANNCHFHLFSIQVKIDDRKWEQHQETASTIAIQYYKHNICIKQKKSRTKLTKAKINWKYIYLKYYNEMIWYKILIWISRRSCKFFCPCFFLFDRMKKRKKNQNQHQT